MTESEDESDVDFSASEDEYVPTEEDDSGDSDGSDDKEDSEESEVEEDKINQRSRGSKPTTSNSKKRSRNQDDDNDSDSSVENYLVNPNEIDLASDFFTSKPNAASNIPTFDCNIGVSLSDSDEEVFEDVPSTSQSETSKPLDFNAHENFNKELEIAKEHLKNFKSTNFGQDSNENDVKKLLAIGEPSVVAPSSSSKKKRNKDLNASDESDWEEVEGEAKAPKKDDVEVRIGPTVKTKLNKHQAEIEASIKRKINRIKKENQLAMHKVHLLSWIAYGNFVNKVLNSTKLMEMVVKFIPSEKCYPKSQTDVKFFEQIIKWYKTVVGLKSKEQNCSLKCLPPIASSLALQIQSKMAICKKDFVFIFIVLLRSMGIQCRLVINLATVPIRPPANELCVISVKNTDQKTPGTKETVKSSKRKIDSKVDSKGGKASSSKQVKRVQSKSKSDVKLKSKINSDRNDMPSTSSNMLKKNSETSNNTKSLKSKLDEAVKSTKKTDSKDKTLKRRSLSLSVSSSVVDKSKRTRIATLVDDKFDGPRFTKTNTNNISSPISGRTRRRLSTKNSDVLSHANIIAKKIPQLDGGDDRKTKKQKPKLFKLKLPFQSSSVSRSPSPSATKESSLSRTQQKSDSNVSPTSPTKTASTSASKSSELDSKSVSTSTQSQTKIKNEKPQLSKLKVPRRSRSVAKSPSVTPSTSNSISKRSNSTSKLKSNSVSASTIKSISVPVSITKTGSTLTPTTMSPAKVSQRLRSKTKPTPSTPSKSQSTSKTSKEVIQRSAKKRKSLENVSSDSDFAPTPKKKVNVSVKNEKPLPKAVEMLKKRIDRRILSTDDESLEPPVKKNDMNYWIEVFCEAEDKWMCIDLFKLKVNSVDDIKKSTKKPIAYVFAWNNNNTIKDVSSRYCSQWNTTTRKLRVESEWINEALSRYKEPNTLRSLAEDHELNKIHLKEPFPTSISEFKNHPLYALKRHLLKFEGIYPPDAITCGFIRDEGIYLRSCVHTLHSREIWVKQARVVKLGESPYKIVKARPKWDRLANKMLESQPLEIFGFWQTQAYEPPTAENGIVPRNAYGNVELFKPEMLPKKTVHLQLAGLNRVCSKLKIDCAQAVVGFDFHGGSSHPTFDGFVVCEEFVELVTVKWLEEQEESIRKAEEKRTQRIFDNWKKLFKGLFLRERLQRKYNFAGKDASSSSKK